MTNALLGLPRPIAAREAEPSSRSKNERVEEVVEQHYDLVWRSLRRFGVADAEADDAAQQVFCVFAQRLDDVPPEKVKTFLFGVVLRIAHASRRQRARRAEVSDDEAIAKIASRTPDAEEQLDDARARVVLDELLAQLPLDLRAVFVLYEIEEMTMAEIATTLELPPGTVASRLRRAREAFKELADDRRAAEQNERHR
jgi:RNA polymerase sigma-70 factor (ECF subfamily)